MPQFVIHGDHPLKGEVRVSGSKNAALPILAATLLTDKLCVIKNVPNIEDIHTMIEILRGLGSEIEFKNHVVKIRTRKIKQGGVPRALGCKMRASVLLLGPLLARTGYARLPYPGGCVLGARPINTHIDILRQLGAKKTKSGRKEIIFKGFPSGREIVLPEFSVTGTENALMAAALKPQKTSIRLAATEPHVQDLCRFLVKLGVSINGIGSHNLEIKGRSVLKGAVHPVTSDYLEAGTFALAAILTGGNVVVKNIMPGDLDPMWNLLREMGAKFKLGKNFVEIKPQKGILKACERLQTNVFPGFPTDLQPPFAVLLTQARGESYVHEALFEGRFKFFPELCKMGAKIEIKNPHEALIKGPVKLRGTQIKSWDIRAGAAMILAGLAAKGTTAVTDIQYIDRGYENLDEKLHKLGAQIERR